MTTATERTISLLSSLQLFEEMRLRSDVPDELRLKSEQILRHFPRAGDIASVANFCEQHTLAPHIFCANDPSTPELAILFLSLSKHDLK